MCRLRVRLAVLAAAGAVGIAAAQELGGWRIALAAAALATLSRLAGGRRAAVVALAVCVGALAAVREARERDRARASLAGVEDGVEDAVEGHVRGPVAREPGEVELVLETGGGARVLVSLHHDGDEDEPDILPGDRAVVRGLLRWPRGFRVPGAPDAERWAAARGVVALLAGDAARAEWWPGWSPWRVATAMQRRLADRVHDPVLRALVTGDRGAMSEAEAARWRDSGAAHVLAVSGLHLAVVALLAFAAVRRAWAAVPALALRVEPARAAALVGAPLAVAYTAATGAPPSAVRAMWVVLLFFAGVLFDRRVRLPEALGAAAILILAPRPSALWDPSVELSFAATAAVGLALSGRRARGWLRTTITSSLWAWLATAPITAVYFGQIALAGPVANLVAVPAVELCALPVGLLGALVAEAWADGGAALIAIAAAVTGRVSSALAHLAAWIPPLAVAAPGRLELAAWSAALVAAAVAARGPARWRGRALVVLAAAAAVAAGAWLWWTAVAPARRQELIAAFLDVGQGDAAVIEVPGGGAWLVDAGGLPFARGGDPSAARRSAEAPGREAVLRYLGARHIRRLDLAILSHPHPDHVRGLAALAGAVPIGTLWLARPDPGRPLPDELAATIADLAARGTRIVYPPIGTAWRQGGAAVVVLAPGSGGVAAVDPVWSENDSSLVVRIDVAGRRLLFAGDVEEEGEAALLARPDLAADLVKVPHHGSPTSSGAAFVAATRPRWAVISLGSQNQFGFPHPAVVARWRAAGAEVLRTDQVGTIIATIAPDGRMEVAGVASPSAAE
ncbi:MAG TPA: DNA internalization-related competence protein ComEC/Rec2 [Kofleriaceae bacterium]